MNHNGRFVAALVIGMAWLGVCQNADAGVKGKSFRTLCVGLAQPPILFSSFSFGTDGRVTMYLEGDVVYATGTFTETGTDALTTYSGPLWTEHFPSTPEFVSGTCILSTFTVGIYSRILVGPTYFTIGIAE